MVEGLAWLVGLILFGVSGMHVYWMAGGQRGALAAIPSSGAKPLFHPSKTATGVVAGAMAMAAWFVLELGGGVQSQLFPSGLHSVVGWALSSVFLLRAVGDFRWLGFFKRAGGGSLFAKWDTILYSPLCLFVGVSVLILLTN